MKRRQFIAYTLMAGAGICGGCIFANSLSASSCVTSDDILGPYYRAGAPLRNDLTFPGVKGVPLQVVGTVKSSDCVTALKDTRIEVWHCSSDGEYDNESLEYRYRGEVRSNENGHYSFKTILPGRYSVGDSFRPAHIHFKITHSEHVNLVTQLYFSGDPYLDSDPFSSQAKARRRILPTADTDGGGKKVNFDAVLAHA